MKIKTELINLIRVSSFSGKVGFMGGMQQNVLVSDGGVFHDLDRSTYDLLKQQRW